MCNKTIWSLIFGISCFQFSYVEMKSHISDEGVSIVPQIVKFSLQILSEFFFLFFMITIFQLGASFCIILTTPWDDREAPFEAVILKQQNGLYCFNILQVIALKQFFSSSTISCCFPLLTACLLKSWIWLQKKQKGG